MCAEYVVKLSKRRMRRALAENPAEAEASSDAAGDPAERADETEAEVRIRLYDKAPVIAARDGRAWIGALGFSLKPRDVTYPTFNARLLSWDEKRGRAIGIHEKPTWRGPLARHRCLVPMTGFVEPVYSGTHAGQMVRFAPTDGDLLFCPGIYESGVDRKTGEAYEGFALILHVPSAFVLATGHHRQPVFLKPAQARKWISPQEIRPELATKFLLENRFEPDLAAEKSRDMARGWEKRVAESERKFAEERELMTKLDNGIAALT